LFIRVGLPGHRERRKPGRVARRLALVWGVHPIVTEDARDERDMAERACRHAYIEGFAGAGERIIVVAGVPLNNLRIATVGG
jgi:pyruvate kinase